MSSDAIYDEKLKLWKQLGKAGKPDLSIEDHGILTLFVSIDFGGSSQGFGGYSLDTWDKKLDRRVGTSAGMDWILRLLAMFGVSRLEEITGRPVYALKKSDGWNETIIGLLTPDFDGGRSFIIEDWRRDWFPEEVAKEAAGKS